MYDIVIDEFLKVMNRMEFSRAEMARRVGVESSTLGKYLMKQRKMPLDVALNIAQILNVDISYLCNLQAEKINENEREILTGLRKVSDIKRVSVSMALLNILQVLN